MIRRVRSVALAAMLVTGVLAATPLSGSADTINAPDLGMAPLSDLFVERASDGRSLLRFSATIVNVGAGPFDLAAQRSSTDSPFSVTQVLSHSDGGSSSVPAPVELVFGGDGHGHWHIKDLESYELRRLDNGVKVGTSAKSGFCFFDTTPYRLSLPGAPQSRVYTAAGCGEQGTLDITMGLSVGWGDRYPWTLPDQYIDISGLANGKYRLVATADPQGKFAESDNGNNLTWVDLNLSRKRNGTTVKVLGYGPAA